MILPFLIHMVRSRKSNDVEGVVKSHLRIPKSLLSHFICSHSPSFLPRKIPNSSLMNRKCFRRCFRLSWYFGISLCFSRNQKLRFANIMAIEVPMAVPINCRKQVSPSVMMLFLITSSRAFKIVFVGIE